MPGHTQNVEDKHNPEAAREEGRTTLMGGGNIRSRGVEGKMLYTESGL